VPALLIAGKIVERTSFRTIDLVGTQALARWPPIFAGLIALPKGLERFANYLLEQIRQHGGRALQPPGTPPVTESVASIDLFPLSFWE
jgi:hypothetical protein